MKGLFVVFHGFSAHSGISKKIFSQCDALRRNGADVELCHLEIAADGTQRRMVGGRAIRTFGQGLRAKIAKRVSLGDITRHIRDEGVEFLYIRHDHNASPVLIHWLRKVKKLGVRIALEIPTLPLRRRIRAITLRAQAETLHRPHLPPPDGPLGGPHRDLLRRTPEIFSRPTIRISNGIDFRDHPAQDAAKRAAPTKSGCWPWRTFTSGTVWTA